MKTCSIEACISPARTRGWCNRHYHSWRKHGDPLASDSHATRTRISKEAFAESFIEAASGCHEWAGVIDNKGYGRISVDGKRIGAHRYAWEQANGLIPTGLFIDHACGNRCCINIEHLRLATLKQNAENLTVQPRASSGYRGVHRSKSKWMVAVRHNGTAHRVYGFNTPEEADVAARTLRNELFTHNAMDR